MITPPKFATLAPRNARALAAVCSFLAVSSALAQPVKMVSPAHIVNNMMAGSLENNPPPAPPVPTLTRAGEGSSAPLRNTTGEVDKILRSIAANLKPNAEYIDAPAEMTINRDLNLSRSVGMMLRPVGYMQVNDQKVIYASEDGQRLLRLTVGSRLGLMKIKKISQDGVEYEVGGKIMHAPMAYTTAEAPKTGGAPAPAATPTPASR